MPSPAFWLAALACLHAGITAAPTADTDAGSLRRANIIDGQDERDSLTTLGPSMGLSSAEITRIRAVTGYVGCFRPSPSVGTGTLFLDNRQVLTAGHILFDPSGTRRTKCFFKNQAEAPVKIDLLEGPGDSAFGAVPVRAGSNRDFAIVRLAEAVLDAAPFPVDETVPVQAGDALVVVTAHPAGMDKDRDKAVPVVQPCRVRRVPLSNAKTNFYRTDCDASGSSSGGVHLARVNGALVLRGMTITSGPWQDDRLRGAPYDEQRGSVTTALGTDAAILQAGRRLAASRR